MEGNEASVRQSTYIKQSGGLPIKAVLPVFLLPVFNFIYKNNKSEPMTNRHKVRIILLWWRRGESNPCPKNIPIRFLRVQTVFDNAYDAKKPTKAASMRSFYPRLL